MPQTAEKAIEVNVPVNTAYNQWTQFESFPSFMEGIEEVKQIDDAHVHWRAKIGGKEEEWDAEIVEQVPDQKIAWKSQAGVYNSGTVTFQSLGPDQTRVMLELEYEPEGMVEKAGDMLGVVQRRIEGDLSRFKEYIESRGVEEGGWRGEIHREAS